MKRSLLFVSLLVFSFTHLLAQVFETDPGIPTLGQPLTIYFNSDQLDPTASLYNFEGDLYAHTGVTIDGNRWQNVIESWGNNTTQPMLTYLGSYRYKLEITPDIEHFYPDGATPIPAGTDVSEICLVIRNAEATAQTSPDKFIPIFEAGLEVSISNPAERTLIKELNESIDIEVSAAFADSLVLFIDDVRIKKGASSDQLSHTYLADSYGDTWIKAVAYDLPETVADSFFLFIPQSPVIEALPAGLEDGINYVSETAVTLVLTAPGKTRAFVLGDFNNWITSDNSYMKRTPDGKKFWIELSDLTSGLEYRFQYWVDGIFIGDPYSEKVLDPWNDQYIDEETYPGLIDYPENFANGIVSVLQTNSSEYEWQSTGYMRPEKKDLVIYELLLRDFLALHNYKTLIDTLDYLSGLGVNAIELMPVNEFDGNESWGYNPSYYFAPDKYYGTKDHLKEFIDTCHGRGIAVILDVVLNHATGNSPLAKLFWDAGNNKTAADNPWFNPDATHDFNVFHDFNHDSELTRYHAKRVMSHWIEEYKVDGYRFDLSKGFTQNNTVGNVGAWGLYDAARISLWKMYADHIWSLDPDFYVILEHFAENSEEKELAEYGMMPWSGYNVFHNYQEASMGWNSNINSISYQSLGWSVPHSIGYMESHDEERMQVKNESDGNSSGDYNIKEVNTGLERLILSATFFFTVPGPKMIWQFGELGYNHSIDLNGRTGKKPIRWDFFSVPERKTVYQSFAALIKLKTSEPAFSSSDYSITQEGKMKRIAINHESMDVRILGNFDVSSGFLSAEFSETGKWYEFFTGDSIDVSNTSELFTLQPGEYRLYTTKRFDKPSFAVSVHDLFAKDYNNEWFTIFPNPISDFVTVDFGDDSIDRIENLTIFSLDGRLVYKQTDLAGKEIDLTSLSKGSYLMGIEAGGKRGIKRILKVK